METYTNVFQNIISSEHLFTAWDAFKRGKRARPDVQAFERDLEENLFQLHRELAAKTYRHGAYADFYIRDPKQRHIHKAAVRDRVLHHAIFSALNPIFEPTFVPTSFSCRMGYGTHRGVKALAAALRKVSKNGTARCFALKCDVRRFFEGVDHGVLRRILERRIRDTDARWLLADVIESFTAPSSTSSEGRGIPIGNLTSQLFANIYLNDFDQFVKHQLRIPYYFRYTDDFVIVDGSGERFGAWLDAIRQFLRVRLKLELHPGKITVRKYRRGVDFLGYVNLPHHRVLRTKTKRRIMHKVGRGVPHASLQSYLGVLSHANSFRLSRKLKNLWWLSRPET